MKKLIISLIVFFFLLQGKSFSQNWTYVNNTGTTFILYGMSFPPGQSSIGFACGMQYTYDADGVIVKTTDGGNNWTQVWPASGTIDGLQGIWFTSNLVGFACGWNNYFIKTTDGGTTWTPVTVGADVWYYRDVEFWDVNNGIAVAVMNNEEEQAAFITSNGGTSWTPATSGLAVADVMGISYASQSVVYGAGSSGSVYKSTDGGHNWTVNSTLSAMLLGVDFANTTFGVIGGEEKIFATNNGGSSYTTYTTGYENFYATLAFSDGTGYCEGTDENIYKTTNGGQTWDMDFNGPGASSLYRIRATADGTLFACGSQGVIMKMTPPLDADFTANPTTVCTGGTVNFYDNSTGAIDSWSWTFEGGTPSSSSQENPVVTYNTPGMFDVQLTVTSGSYNSTELKTNLITVYGALVAPATPTGPAEVCGGYSYQYMTQAVQYAEGYQWQVSPAYAGSMSGNDIVGTFMASNSWEGTYSIKVRAENNCGNGPWSSELTGTLYHNPIVFDLLGAGTYCEGDPGSEITLSGSETGISYELYKDNISTGIVLDGTGAPLSFGFFQETGLYTANAFTAHCDENMVGQVYVHMEPLPGQAGTPTGPADVCNDESSQYVTSGASDADSYLWSLVPENSGTITSNAASCTIDWEPGLSGAASLSVTGVNVCGSGVPSGILPIMVNNSPAPAVDGLTFICDNEQADYTSPAVSGDIYSWNATGGSILAGQGTSQVTVLWGSPGSGTVSLTESNNNGCSGVSEILVTIDDCTGLGEIQGSSLQVYPNPFKDYIIVTGDEKVTVRLYNLLGEILLIDEHLSGRSEINTSSLAKSIYLVKIEQAGKMSAFLLIKQ
jgi:PKD repeat protein